MEFDDCSVSPTGKHSESWFVNDNCQYCKTGLRTDDKFVTLPILLTPEMESVIENRNSVYQSAQELFDALVAAARAAQEKA